MNPLTPAISFFNQPTIDGWNPKVGLWTGQYNWAAMRNVSVLTEGNTALVGQIGVLMYQIRQAGTNNIINAPPSEVTFDPVTNQAYFPDLIDLIEEMGYSTGSGFTYVAYDDNTPNAVYFRTVRKFTLDAGYPYLVIGINQNMSVAHIWLVDGYGSMSTYTEKLVNPNNGQYMIITIGNPNGTLLVHCNMGLGYGNGWYIDSLFDMANMANFPDNSMGPDDALNVSSYVNWLLPLPIN
jgi:hypothetical protein